ncbi:WD40 repeat-like protein [Sorochytrium milnesiophthora]
MLISEHAFACSTQLSGDPKGKTFLYTNGRSVIIRDIANPAIASEYTEHACPVTVARYAPTGYYVASGDQNGNVRIWDTTQETRLLKAEYKILSGRLSDLCWDFESKRIIAVGDGKERFGHAFNFDTGTSVGEISGHSKAINAVSVRQQRPFRAATCSDDMTVNFYHGAPYKFNMSITDHTRFVQAVKFSPDGALFATAGSDSKIFLYDGSTGAKVKELSSAEGSHTGSVFALSWSPDSKSLMSSSGDMTVKLWDVAAAKVQTSFAMSATPTVDDQQVANLWQGEYLLSVSLSGNINYLDPRAGNISRIVSGHQKNIMAITKASPKQLYTGSYDGRVYKWSLEDGLAAPVGGHGHSNQVNSLYAQEGAIHTVGLDDTVRLIDVSTNSFSGESSTTGSLPKDVAAHDKTRVVTTLNSILLQVNGKTVQTLNTDVSANCVAFSPGGTEVAVGMDNHKVKIFKLEGDKLEPAAELSNNRGAITALAYSPDGKLLAAADGNRQVLVYDAATREVKISAWVFHTTRVNAVGWSPDSQHAVSGGLDTNVYVWSVEKPMKHIAIKGAHVESVTGAIFIDNNTIATVGNDSCVKTWEILQYP